MVKISGTAKELNDVIRHFRPGHPLINFDSVAWNLTIWFLNGVFVQVECEGVEESGKH